MSKNTELLGVKVKSSTKDRITVITEKAKAAGMIEYNGDIFDLFVERFQHDELSKKMEYGADLKELSQITRRINDIFINLAERNETNLGDLRNQHDHITISLNEEIKVLKERVKEVIGTLTEKDSKFNELTSLLQVNQERMKELEAVQNGYTERIEEQKSFIDEKDKKIAAKNEMISQKEEAISAMKEDIAQIDKLMKNIYSLYAEITVLKQTNVASIEDLKKQKDALEFECQKRVFAREQELNKETSKEIKAIQDQLSKEMKRSQEKYEMILVEKDKLMNINYDLKVALDRVQNDSEKKESIITAKEKEIAEFKEIIQQLEDASKKN